MKIKGATLYHGLETRQTAVVEWPSIIAELRVAAVIFDCDGTLVESSEAHYRSMKDAAALQGETMSRDWYRERMGFDRESLFTDFLRHARASFDPQKAVADSIAAFSDHVTSVTPITETAELLRHLHLVGYKIAVGTNAEAHVARQSLVVAGVDDFVPVLVSITDNLPPKPSPDIFLHAAKRLGVLPERALVIEDSPQGLAAARSAGMTALLLGPAPVARGPVDAAIDG